MGNFSKIPRSIGIITGWIGLSDQTAALTFDFVGPILGKKFEERWTGHIFG